jgi:NAD(P)-dependent dehydrogenase (short-subunit alcohol dehydrogenase family)
MQGEKNIALVTGSSSGIGFETALLLARNGYHTYASMRNLEKSKNIAEIANREKLPLQVVQLDVTDDRSIKEAIGKVESEQGSIDVLVNNAGYVLLGPVEQLSIEEFKEQFETNLFGVIRIIKAVLPTMRRQRGGRIVNISSSAGRIGLPLNSAYVSSKFALEGLSESITYEVEQFGIRVVIIEPGFIRTNLINSGTLPKKALDPKSPYFSLMRKVENHFKSRMENISSSSSPEEVAKVILQAIRSENPELRYTVGTTIVQARMNMPDREFRKMIMQSFSM